MKHLLSVFVLPAVSLILFSTSAHAHLPSGEYGSFASGFTHPLFGFDHLLAMIAVGLWASMIGKRAVWAVPAIFVCMMIAGFGLALMQMPLPFVEPMILASVIVFGFALAIAVRIDARLCAVLVGLFALFHGHAHGGEIGDAGAMQFTFGFVLATALLHLAGIGIGLLAPRISASLDLSSNTPYRALGAVTIVTGVLLTVS